WLTASACRALEPGLSPAICGGLFSEEEASIDPRRLVGDVTARRRVREGVEVVSVARDAVTTSAGETITAGRVVVCAGAWSGLPGVPVRPVEGQGRARRACPSGR